MTLVISLFRCIAACCGKADTPSTCGSPGLSSRVRSLAVDPDEHSDLVSPDARGGEVKKGS